MQSYTLWRKIKQAREYGWCELVVWQRLLCGDKAFDINVEKDNHKRAWRTFEGGEKHFQSPKTLGWQGQKLKKIKFQDRNKLYMFENCQVKQAV